MTDINRDMNSQTDAEASFVKGLHDTQFARINLESQTKGRDSKLEISQIEIPEMNSRT